MPNTKPLFPTTMTNIPSSPFKKRRFFDDFANVSLSSSPASLGTTISDLVAPPQEAMPPHLAELRAILGPEVSVELLEKLYKMSGENLDVAVNRYFEGSLKQDDSVKTERNVMAIAKENDTVRDGSSSTQRFTSAIFAKKKTKCEVTSDWRKRYIGELIAIGTYIIPFSWSSFKGPTPLSPGDKVHIERTLPTSQLASKRGKSVSSSRPNTIVRFTTLPNPQSPRPVEVGRLPLATARYVSKLLDLGACSFEGFVVHCPDRLSTGDDVILQLRVFITQRAFSFDPYNRRSDQMQNLVPKRPVFDKTAETDQEREARERRVALLAILKAMGAKPIRAARSDAGDDAYRDNLVAAEEAPEGGGGKRAGSEEVEEGEGIDGEEKQISEEELDNLYEKAQKFDAALPEMEPPKEMVLELRSYQKQVVTISSYHFLSRGRFSST
ncbi:hypothetical protein BC937DRAFT_90243 [Endogone sp. FLAS-F59071]|nr:hypothetical protein BC937DRAFT_90243 [Endogone sp. FLAS-F59071]|eukprot:RUS17232.1 hypothetical protein BC937DRAFT_90243 [Endogone sp. FLAS-F59071]